MRNIVMSCNHIAVPSNIARKTQSTTDVESGPLHCFGRN